MTRPAFTYPTFVAFFLVAACAATAPPLTDFPAGVRTPSAADVTGLLKGKSFNQASGGIRTDYGADRNDITAYIAGRAEKGTWRAEDGRVCFEFTTLPSVCNELRLLGTDIYVKRSNGQVTQLLAR